MSEGTRRDIVLIVIFSLVSAIGMASVFLVCRFLAWIVIAISDLYHIRFQTVEARSSVRDRLRHEGVDSKLGGVNRFATVADVIDHFQRERNASPLQPNEPHPTE
jgi:Na+-transporting methylmalonyl-CoA/oxaloacetate decarboxylase gamma subunit